MNRPFLEAIKIFFIIFSIIFIIISTILVLWQLFGNSPSDIMVIFSALGIVVTLEGIVISVLFQIKEDFGGLKEFKRQ